ncbi:MAG: hypothetical protein DBY32_01360 [Phascolarctobacterium sp.]|nr:MAG: hypothetical protein DBY32_01360 [Phascolarctobacterium sp.]
MSNNQIQKVNNTPTTFSDDLLSAKFQNLPEDMQNALAKMVAEEKIKLDTQVTQDMIKHRNAQLDIDKHINVAHELARENGVKRADKIVSDVKTASGNMRIESKSGSCYVATATYQNKNHPNVIILRDFRDRFLAKTFTGKCFIKFYYTFGPYLAILPNKFNSIRTISKICLDKIVHKILLKYYIK